MCVRTALSIRPVGRPGRICTPEGRLRIARRFQRRVKWNTERVPEGRLKVLTHPLKPPILNRYFRDFLLYREELFRKVKGFRKASQTRD